MSLNIEEEKIWFDDYKLLCSTEQFKGGIKKNFTNYFASDECRVMRNLVENSFDTSMYDMNKVFLGYSNEILQKFQNDLARTTKNYQDAKDEFIKLVG